MHVPECDLLNSDHKPLGATITHHKELRKSLMDEGGSMVLAGSNVKAKVHIHTNSPARIFSICEKYGIVSGQKADDMFQQQKSAQNSKMGEIAIVTDSGADFNTNEYDIHVMASIDVFFVKCFCDSCIFRC